MRSAGQWPRPAGFRWPAYYAFAMFTGAAGHALPGIYLNLDDNPVQANHCAGVYGCKHGFGVIYALDENG